MRLCFTPALKDDNHMCIGWRKSASDSYDSDVFPLGVLRTFSFQRSLF